MRAISLFTGAGGLDLGCEAAGFLTVAAVEHNDRARETLLANADRYFPLLGPERVSEDILDTDVSELLERADAAPGEIDLVHGGPPCTPFSKSGYWLAYKRAGSDPKASLIDEFVRIVAGVRPKAFLMENVFALAYRNQNREVFTRFLQGMDAAGYAVDTRTLIAADFGVPQLRQRLICVGLRKDLWGEEPHFWKFGWPAPTHSGPHETRRVENGHLPPHRTTAEAFAGLDDANNPPEHEEVVQGTYADDLKVVPPGDNYLFLTEKRGHPSPRFKWRTRYWTFLLKLHPDRAAPTIQGQPGPWVGPFHWDNRRLRVAELKRLMEFPDDFLILGSRREQQLQLGNAVPMRLGYAIADAIRAELDAVGVSAAKQRAA
jgi:DNA (cytosine-5)-methyltransferase 1